MKALAPALLIAAGLATTAGVAQDKVDNTLGEQAELADFAALDMNQDQLLTFDEISAKYDKLRKEDFDAADADRDNKLTADELKSLNAALSKEK